jgi:hypothetical protein
LTILARMRYALIAQAVMQFRLELAYYRCQIGYA